MCKRICAQKHWACRSFSVSYTPLDVYKRQDVGRAMAIPYAQVDTVAKLVPNELHMTLDKALTASKDFKQQYDTDPTIHELIDMARKLEGMPRHASTHAAGVVITRDPVDTYVPVQKNEEAILTQFPMTTRCV